MHNEVQPILSAEEERVLASIARDPETRFTKPVIERLISLCLLERNGIGFGLTQLGRDRLGR